MPTHTPLAERQRLVAQWRDDPRSPSMSAFARSVGVSPSTFIRWVADLSEDLAPAAFVELTHVDGPAGAPPGLALRLEGPGHNDVQLVFDTPPPPDWFGQMLWEVLSC